MRAEIGLTSVDEAVPDHGPAPPSRLRPRSRALDTFDLWVLAVFAAISLWVVAADLWEVVVNGRVWTGTDGVYIVDQMQYLAWIRDASNHFLSSNLFVLRSTPHDYFQPAVTVSAGLTALGVAPWLSLLLWKPVAVGTGFWAARSYVNRSLEDLWDRRAALVLCLFFGCFTVIFGTVSVLGDLFPGFLSWGYTFGLIALAAMVGGLLTYDRAVREQRIAWMPGLLGGIASLLHPWQGEALIVLVLAGEAVMLLSGPFTRKRFGLAALTIGLTAAPLLYYVILTRADLSWHLARQASKHSFPLGSIVIAILPLMAQDVPRVGHPLLAVGGLRRLLPLGHRRGGDAVARLSGDHVPAVGPGRRRRAQHPLEPPAGATQACGGRGGRRRHYPRHRL
jgi:hypothetical protein